MSKPAFTLEEIRRAIDEADEILIRALGARFRAALHLQKLKADGKLPVEDPEREEVLKSLWKDRAKRVDVSPELALLILDFILTESKRIQQS